MGTTKRKCVQKKKKKTTRQCLQLRKTKRQGVQLRVRTTTRQCIHGGCISKSKKDIGTLPVLYLLSFTYYSILQQTYSMVLNIISQFCINPMIKTIIWKLVHTYTMLIFQVLQMCYSNPVRFSWKFHGKRNQTIIIHITKFVHLLHEFICAYIELIKVVRMSKGLRNLHFMEEY